jgi:DMSO/TMAO reductase YedYZ molybdopterin-dependent catalytic subunit
MAHIVIGCYMVRYPLGGALSWPLQWLVGFQRLGHEVYMVEKAVYQQSCFDPRRNLMTDDCAFGVDVVRDLLERFGLENKFCFVDAAGAYYGQTRPAIEQVFASADLFLDLGTHGAWLPEAAGSQLRVVVDGEPGFRQIKWQQAVDAGQTLPQYDRYYTNGFNIAAGKADVPQLGIEWRHVANPIVLDLVAPRLERCEDAAFTTVMNWHAHDALEYRGLTYGQKDVEFQKFIDLPVSVDVPMEIAVSGRIPRAALAAAGWRMSDAHEMTRTYNSYHEYISRSRGEFSVCKHVFVATNSGWFSDRSAAYLAHGRPVVLEDTGFSDHLPCGRGLFAVRSLEEAADAIREILAVGHRHRDWARELAREHFDTRNVLPRFLSQLGI